MNRDFSPYLLTPFRPPPKLADSLRRSSPGSCEHPKALREPKNPTLSGAAPSTVTVPGQGRGPGTNLTLAFEDFDKRNEDYEKDRVRWLEHQLSPNRGQSAGGGGTGGGVTLEIESANANLTVSPTGPQEQTAPIKWTLTVNEVTFVPRWG